MERRSAGADNHIYLHLIYSLVQIIAFAMVIYSRRLAASFQNVQ